MNESQKSNVLVVKQGSISCFVAPNSPDVSLLSVPQDEMLNYKRNSKSQHVEQKPRCLTNNRKENLLSDDDKLTPLYAPEGKYQFMETRPNTSPVVVVSGATQDELLGEFYKEFYKLCGDDIF